MYALEGLEAAGMPADRSLGSKEAVTRHLDELAEAGMPSIHTLLPLLLRYAAEPYSLADYAPFEAFYRTRQPLSTTIKGSRQIAKTMNDAAQAVLEAALRPNYNILCVAPLFETVRRFSQGYIKDFIDTSPMRDRFIGPENAQNVLQKQFRSGSTLYFSYAFLDARQLRGIPAKKIKLDETQDFPLDLLPILYQNASSAKPPVFTHGGTPKGLGTTLEYLWQESSMAEWYVKCQRGGCNYWNIPNKENDLLDMIGPVHDGISGKSPGTVCADCGKPLSTRHGQWVHTNRDLRWTHAGYHIPQTILPLHNEDADKWGILVGAQQGRANYSATQFLNEICGESADDSSQLLSETDLRRAACLDLDNDWRQAVTKLDGYKLRVLAVDWGGGAGNVLTSDGSKKGKLRTSFTSMALMGMRSDGKVDVLWGHRSLRTMDYDYEAQIIHDALTKFRCRYLVHDYNGAGAVREQLLVNRGWPVDRIAPMAYHGSGKKGIVIHHPAEEDHPRDWYSVDKHRSLATTIQAIKDGWIRTFRYDRGRGNDTGLLSDFLALTEMKVETRLTDVFTISRHPAKTDDFAQAVNMGACALWFATKSWPSRRAAKKYSIPSKAMMDIDPHFNKRIDWDRIK